MSKFVSANIDGKLELYHHKKVAKICRLQEDATAGVKRGEKNGGRARKRKGQKINNK